MSRDQIRDRAESNGWWQIRAWHDSSVELNAADDYFLRHETIIRIKYDKIGRIKGAHKWERGDRAVTRLGRLAPGKSKRVIGWICAQPICTGG